MIKAFEICWKMLKITCCKRLHFIQRCLVSDKSIPMPNFSSDKSQEKGVSLPTPKPCQRHKFIFKHITYNFSAPSKHISTQDCIFKEGKYKLNSRV